MNGATAKAVAVVAEGGLDAATAERYLAQISLDEARALLDGNDPAE